MAKKCLLQLIKKESEKSEFVRSLFLDLGRKASPAAVAALVGALGNDLRELSGAVTQISADAPAGLIDELTIDKYHQGRIETTGFDCKKHQMLEIGILCIEEGEVIGNK